MKKRLANVIAAHVFLTTTAAILTLASISEAGAGRDSYVCEIIDYLSPHKQGSVGWQTDFFLYDLARKTTVAIDRSSGRVIHPFVGNTSFATVTLLNSGNPEWSFKAIADSGNGGNVRYYEVQEYVEGARKPFIIVADGIALSGICQ